MCIRTCVNLTGTARRKISQDTRSFLIFLFNAHVIACQECGRMFFLKERKIKLLYYTGERAHSFMQYFKLLTRRNMLQLCRKHNNINSQNIRSRRMIPGHGPKKQHQFVHVTPFSPPPAAFINLNIFTVCMKCRHYASYARYSTTRR